MKHCNKSMPKNVSMLGQLKYAAEYIPTGWLFVDVLMVQGHKNRQE